MPGGLEKALVENLLALLALAGIAEQFLLAS